MTNITVDAKELTRILECTPPSQNILIAGKHGIGKSQIVTDFFESREEKVTALFLGQMSDPGDIIGLPRPNEATGRMDFMPPYWFPKDGEKIVLFLDELNRARPEILQTVMDLTLNRKLAGRSLPEGSRIVSAVNSGDEYEITDLDPALVSRFNVYTFCPKVDDWLEWAEKKGLDQRVINFIRYNPAYLDTDGISAGAQASDSLTVTPDRRSWQRISDIIKDIPMLEAFHAKLFTGLLGENVASLFVSDSRYTVTINGYEILDKGQQVFDEISPLTLPEKTRLVDRLYDNLSKILNEEKITENQRQNLSSFILWAEKIEPETLSYFASIFLRGKYPDVNEFISKECREAYEGMIGFVSRI